MKKKVLVVDLDGTLYTINTFHYFLKFLIFYCIKHFNIVLLLKIVGILALRLFKKITHAKMKYDILRSISNRINVDYQNFVEGIALKKRSIPVMHDDRFEIKILATAAPSCYANIIAEKENFHKCLGTDFPKTGFNDAYENIKAVKRNNVVNYLKSKGIIEIEVFVTDHIDDLPLMKLAKRNLIVNPNEIMKSQLKQNLISYETIF